MDYLIFVSIAVIVIFLAEAFNWWSSTDEKARDRNLFKGFFKSIKEWENKNLPK